MSEPAVATNVEKLGAATDDLLRRARRELGPRENTAVDPMGAFATLNSLLDLVTVLDTRVRSLERRLERVELRSRKP